MDSFDRPGDVPHMKLLSNSRNFCAYTGIHENEEQYREVAYISLKAAKPR